MFNMEETVEGLDNGKEQGRRHIRGKLALSLSALCKSRIDHPPEVGPL
jgi:hypothetical protein